jgi:uncharacterized protein YjbI with pentapeptide repeats
MPDDQHLALLREGAASWNRWREENPDIIPELSGADLRKADLKGYQLFQSNLAEADLSEADLRGADLNRTSFYKSRLEKANLSCADLFGADFFEANLSGADLRGTQAAATKFKNCQLTGAYIEGWKINQKTNFEGVVCQHVYLKDNQPVYLLDDQYFEAEDLRSLFQGKDNRQDIAEAIPASSQLKSISEQGNVNNTTKLKIQNNQPDADIQVELVKLIGELWRYLSRDYPSSTYLDKTKIVVRIANEISHTSFLKEAVVASIERGEGENLKQVIEAPLGDALILMFKEWKKAA